MADIVLNQNLVDWLLTDGITSIASGTSFYMVLLQTGVPAPDAAHDWSDISAYEADYKGYGPVNVMASASTTSGPPTATINGTQQRSPMTLVPPARVQTPSKASHWSKTFSARHT